MKYSTVERLCNIVFDTTTVNSGQNKGIVVRLQTEFGKNLLQLACLHHVYELVC